MDARRLKLGPLDAIEYPAPKGAPLVVCCHGYGADAADLAGLAPALGTDSEVHWVFPDGPLGLDLGPFVPGRAWFKIDMEEFERAQAAGTWRDLSKGRPEGLTEAAQAVIGLVEATGTPWDQVVLGGFSQGSMTALEAAMKAEAKPAGVFLLSGNLVDREGAEKGLNALEGVPFFQSHGRYDPVLGYEGAVNLKEVLTGAGLSGDLVTFDGAHEIPPVVTAGLKDFLIKTARTEDAG